MLRGFVVGFIVGLILSLSSLLTIAAIVAREFHP